MTRSIEAIREAIVSGKRIVIALDSGGVHFNETLCVTHNGESGETRYDTKPIGTISGLDEFRIALANLCSEQP